MDDKSRYHNVDRRKSDILFAEIHDEFKKIHEAYDKMNENITTMNATMVSLVVAIRGDEFGNDGINQRHKDLNDRFEHFKKNQSNIDKYQDDTNKKKFEDHEKRITILESVSESNKAEKNTGWTRMQILIGWLSFGVVIVTTALNYLKGNNS